MKKVRVTQAIITGNFFTPTHPSMMTVIKAEDDDDAARQAAAMKGYYFDMYSWDSIIDETGAEHSVPKTYRQSPRRYVGVDRLYTLGEAADKIDQAIAELGEKLGHYRSELLACRDAYREITKTMEGTDLAVYCLRDPFDRASKEPPHTFIWLKKGEKAYDANGKLIHEANGRPIPPTPAP